MTLLAIIWIVFGLLAVDIFSQMDQYLEEICEIEARCIFDNRILDMILIRSVLYLGGIVSFLAVLIQLYTSEIFKNFKF